MNDSRLAMWLATLLASLSCVTRPQAMTTMTMTTGGSPADVSSTTHEPTAPTGSAGTVFANKGGHLYPVAVSAARQTVITGGALTLRDLASLHPTASDSEDSTAVAMPASGEFVVSVTRIVEPQRIRHLLSVRDGASLKVRASADGCQHMAAISSDEGLVACQGDSGDEILVLRLPRLDRVAALRERDESLVLSICFVPRSAPAMLAAGYANGRIKLWSIADQKVVKTLAGHQEDVEAIAISPDGRLLVSGSGPQVGSRSSKDNSVRLWSLPDGTLVRALGNHRMTVAAVAFSPSGGLIASGGRDGDIVVYSAATGAVVLRLGDRAFAGASISVVGSEPTWYEGLAFVSEHMLVSGSDDFVATWPIP